MLIPDPFGPDRPKLPVASVDDDPRRVAELEERLHASETAARDLADSARLYKALFSGIATAVTIRSLEDQSFVDCNLAALRLYGAGSIAELRSSKPTDLAPKMQPDGVPSEQAFRHHVGLAIQNGSERCEWRARRLDGTEFMADIRIAILELEGGRKVMQTLIEDITAHKEAEGALRRRAERDELVGSISRRFLDGSAQDGTRFAVATVSAFLGMSEDAVARWIAAPASLDASAPAEDAALLRLVSEIVNMAHARQAAQEEVLSSEERYRMLVERSRSAILVFDLEHRILFANPAACDLAGYDPGEWSGLRLFDLIVAEEHEQLAETIELARRAAPMSVPREWTVRRKDGTLRRVESLRTPVRDKQGAVVGAQVVVSDITERHRTEQMREAAQRELARASEEAVAASRAKSAFVANMSHELRTPLNGVIGMVDLLAQTPLDARQKRFVEVARASASLLLSVISDVLDFSKLEMGRLDIERIEFSFAEVIEEVVAMMELAAEEKGLELRCQVDPAFARPFVGDPARVRQVLVNLITNAIKFTSRGEVSVRASLDRESGNALYARVEVRDTGVGIAEEAQGRLFKPFSQVDTSNTRPHGGAGLGLAICRELVHRMGGDIGVTSRPGQGAVFCFTIRLEQPSADEPASTGALSGLLPASSSPRRVLLVEDTPINAEVAVEILCEAGYVVEVVVDGLQAVEAVQTSTYDLVLMDCQLPGIDGYEATRRIRGFEASGTSRGRQLPIVALTASASLEDLERSRRAGMSDHISKPIDARRLLDVVAGWIEGSPESVRARERQEQSPETHVDLARALARLRGNRDLLARLVEQFREEAVRALDRLRPAVCSRDAAATRYVAHRLRGQALSLDADALVEELESLESAVTRGAWLDLDAGMVRVEGEVHRVLEALAR
jgi:PAS domain S-box-containing protein